MSVVFVEFSVCLQVDMVLQCTHLYMHTPIHLHARTPPSVCGICLPAIIIRSFNQPGDP